MTDDQYIALRDALFLELWFQQYKPDVIASGLGTDETGLATVSGQVAIKLYAKKDLVGIPSHYEWAPNQKVPINVIPTDFTHSTSTGSGWVVGPAPPPGKPVRPLFGGQRINQTESDHGWGTLGFFVREVGNASPVYGVTCQHVLYTDRDDRDERPVYQPKKGFLCSECSPENDIGEVARAANRQAVDGALIELESGTEWLAQTKNRAGGPMLIEGTHSPVLDDIRNGNYCVKKYGARTRYTGGTVHALYVQGEHMLFGQRKRFVDAMEIRGNPQTVSIAYTHFALGGDSGSAVLNESNQLVGMIFAATTNNILTPNPMALVTPWEVVLHELGNDANYTPNLDLEVMTATEADVVNVVPRLASESASGPPEPDLQQDLCATSRGNWLLDTFWRHREELIALVNQNRRVGTVWHRSGMAELMQWGAKALSDDSVRIPREIRGRTPSEVLLRFKQILDRYGSSGLKASLDEVRPKVPPLAGRSYLEVLAWLESVEVEDRTPALA